MLGSNSQEASSDLKSSFTKGMDVPSTSRGLGCSSGAVRPLGRRCDLSKRNTSLAPLSLAACSIPGVTQADHISLAWMRFFEAIKSVEAHRQSVCAKVLAEVQPSTITHQDLVGCRHTSDADQGLHDGRHPASVVECSGSSSSLSFGFGVIGVTQSGCTPVGPTSGHTGILIII